MNSKPAVRREGWRGEREEEGREGWRKCRMGTVGGPRSKEKDEVVKGRERV